MEAGFRKQLGFWSLTAASIGGVIGSGWLFSAMYAAQAAGPAAILAWIIGGLAMLCVGLVYSELGATRPEAGGIVRYPTYSNGTLVSSIVSWSTWISYSANAPTEASAVMQYLSHFFPALYNGKSLTGLGITFAILLMLVFVVINYFGVRLFARVNNTITAIKVGVPLLTIVALLATSFHPGNLNSPAAGGFAPYGLAGALGAIATSGIVFAYTGFRQAIDLSGEAANPKRDVPRAVITVVLVSIVVYLLLQIAFIGALPHSLLSHGFGSINFKSPFANIALLINLTWLSWILYADSAISPTGSAIVYAASNARVTYSMGVNRFFPKFVTRLHPKYRVPFVALFINILLGFTLLLPLPSWHSLIAVMGSLTGFSYATGAVAVIAFRRKGLSGKDTQIRGINIIAPIAFVVSGLISYWAGWDKLSKAIILLIIGIIVYFWSYFHYKKPRKDIVGGIWMLAYIFLMLICSYLGTFGGKHWVPAPWDSIVVAIMSFIIFWIGVKSADWYMRQEKASHYEEYMVSVDENNGLPG